MLVHGRGGNAKGGDAQLEKDAATLRGLRVGQEVEFGRGGARRVTYRVSKVLKPGHVALEPLPGSRLKPVELEVGDAFILVRRGDRVTDYAKELVAKRRTVAADLPDEIKVATAEGKEKVKAQYVGKHWAFHPTLGQEEKRWTVTHRPTGMAAIKSAPNRDAAELYAEMLADLADYKGEAHVISVLKTLGAGPLNDELDTKRSAAAWKTAIDRWLKGQGGRAAAKKRAAAVDKPKKLGAKKAKKGLVDAQAMKRRKETADTKVPSSEKLKRLKVGDEVRVIAKVPAIYPGDHLSVRVTEIKGAKLVGTVLNVPFHPHSHGVNQTDRLRFERKHVFELPPPTLPTGRARNPIKGMPGGSVSGCIRLIGRTRPDVGDPGAYCAAIADRIEPGWRRRNPLYRYRDHTIEVVSTLGLGAFGGDHYWATVWGGPTAEVVAEVEGSTLEEALTTAKQAVDKRLGRAANPHLPVPVGIDPAAQLALFGMESAPGPRANAALKRRLL